jgi:hypothetical protein
MGEIFLECDLWVLWECGVVRVWKFMSRDRFKKWNFKNNLKSLDCTFELSSNLELTFLSLLERTWKPYSCDCRNSQGVFLSGRNLTGSKRLKVYQGCTPQVWVLSRHPGRLGGDTHLVLTHKMPCTRVHEPLVSSYMLNPDFSVSATLCK